MALEPEDRYASCRALAEDVERWTADEPLTAWHEPVSRRARRWARRNRTVVTAAAVATFAALVGTAVVLGVQTRANRDLNAANLNLALANTRVTRANTDLIAANQRETARFDLAMDAIRTFHTGVSQDLLLKEKPFDGLRTNLLRGAANFYGTLEAQLEGQSDRPSRAALGTAYDELGGLTDTIGQKPEALRVHRKALAIRRELAVDPGAGIASKLDVARSLLAIGDLCEQTGDTSGALAAFEEARIGPRAWRHRGTEPTKPVR